MERKEVLVTAASFQEYGRPHTNRLEKNAALYDYVKDGGERYDRTKVIDNFTDIRFYRTLQEVESWDVERLHRFLDESFRNEETRIKTHQFGYDVSRWSAESLKEHTDWCLGDLAKLRERIMRYLDQQK